MLLLAAQAQCSLITLINGGDKKTDNTKNLIIIAGISTVMNSSNSCPNSLRGCCYYACVAYNTASGTVDCLYGYALDSSWTKETACSDCDYVAKSSGYKTKKTNSKCDEIGFTSAMQQSYKYNGYKSSSYACGNSSSYQKCTSAILSFMDK